MNKLRKQLSQISVSAWLLIITAIYTACVVIQNIFEMKTLGSPTFAFAGGGIIISWAVFATMDIITEVWSKNVAVRIFTLAMIVNIIITLMAQIIIAIPGTYGDQNEAFAQIFSNGPRTLLSSAIAFWVGNFINATIMDRLKGRCVDDRHRGLFAFRAILSTVLGQIIDNFLFVVLAFAPIGLSLFEMTWVDIFTSVGLGTSLETIIEALFVLLTASIANKLKIKKAQENCF